MKKKNNKKNAASAMQHQSRYPPTDGRTLACPVRRYEGDMQAIHSRSFWQCAAEVEPLAVKTTQRVHSLIHSFIMFVSCGRGKGDEREGWLRAQKPTAKQASMWLLK